MTLCHSMGNKKKLGSETTLLLIHKVHIGGVQTGDMMKNGIGCWDGWSGSD